MILGKEVFFFNSGFKSMFVLETNSPFSWFVSSIIAFKKDKQNKIQLNRNRKYIHTQKLKQNTKTNYTLTVDQTKLVYQWIKELRMLDGYSSNLARCANVDKGTMHEMKSHDCHVFVECLLLIAFSSLLPHVLNPLIEISHFFKDLCFTTLIEDDLSRME